MQFLRFLSFLDKKILHLNNKQLTINAKKFRKFLLKKSFPEIGELPFYGLEPNN